MKKRILVLPFLLLSLCLPVFSITQDAQDLKTKLNTFKEMNAHFVQRVFSPEGVLLNESRGEMVISRPGKFHWKINEPEEELIVSDGRTIWYYSPFIEQVTLINFNDAVNGTPFALLTGSDGAHWQDYEVKKEQTLFTVNHARDGSAASFSFEFDEQNHLKKFIIIEPQGPRSEFLLTTKPVSNNVNDALFHFIIPVGVEVDDQR